MEGFGIRRFQFPRMHRKHQYKEQKKPLPNDENLVDVPSPKFGVQIRRGESAVVVKSTVRVNLLI